MAGFDKEIKVFKFMQTYGDDLVSDIAPEDFCRQPVAGTNHPAWIIGHLALSSDSHAIYTGNGVTSELDAWDEKFDFGSTLSDDPDDYPPKDELIATWHAANDRYVAAVQNADPEALAQPTGGSIGEDFPTVADFLSFSLTGHVSTHLGQLSAWRRADGRKPLF